MRRLSVSTSGTARSFAPHSRVTIGRVTKSSARLEQRRSAAPPRADGCVVRLAWLFLFIGVMIVVQLWNSGWYADAALAFGLSFLAAGVAILGSSRPWVAAARPRRALSQRPATAGWTGRRAFAYLGSWVVIFLSPWIGAAVGRAVSHEAGFVAGFAAVTAGISGVLLFRRPGAATWRRRRDAVPPPSGPEGPWTKDHAWKAEGEKRTFLHFLATRRMYFGRMCVVVGLLVLPIPASLTTTPFIVGVKFALALGGSWWLWHLARVLSMGSVFLGFLRFPYRPGERAEFTFGVSGGGAEIRDATFVLRHFQESRDGTGPGGGLPFCTASVEEADPPADRVFAPGVDQRLFFDIPADAPVTSISAWKPSYWEMEIRGVTREGPWEERVLVPVYARVANSSDEAEPAMGA
jgi:hypothetical protein